MEAEPSRGNGAPVEAALHTEAESDDQAELVSRLAAAQGEISAVPQSAHADLGTHAYDYSTAGDVREAIRKPLASRGLALTQTFEVREDGVILLHTSLRYRSAAIRSTLPLLLPRDARPQAVGSAMSYARRYSVSALLALASEPDDDGAAAQTARPTAPPPAKRQRARASVAPSGTTSVSAAAGAPEGISERERRRLFATADEAADRIGITREGARTFIKEWCADLGLSSTKDLPVPQLEKLVATLEALTLDGLAKWKRTRAQAAPAPNSPEAPPADAPPPSDGEAPCPFD